MTRRPGRSTSWATRSTWSCPDLTSRRNVSLTRPPSRVSPVHLHAKMTHGRPSVQRRRTKSQTGQVLVIFAGAIIALIGMVAIVVDVSWYWANSLRVQRAADAAALAGAVYLPGQHDRRLRLRQDRGHQERLHRRQRHDRHPAPGHGQRRAGPAPARRDDLGPGPDVLHARLRDQHDHRQPDVQGDLRPAGADGQPAGLLRRWLLRHQRHPPDLHAQPATATARAAWSPHLSGPSQLNSQGFWGSVQTRGGNQGNGDAYSPENNKGGGSSNAATTPTATSTTSRPRPVGEHLHLRSDVLRYGLESPPAVRTARATTGWPAPTRCPPTTRSTTPMARPGETATTPSSPARGPCSRTRPSRTRRTAARPARLDQLRPRVPTHDAWWLVGSGNGGATASALAAGTYRVQIKHDQPVRLIDQRQHQRREHVLDHGHRWRLALGPWLRPDGLVQQPGSRHPEVLPGPDRPDRRRQDASRSTCSTRAT